MCPHWLQLLIKLPFVHLAHQEGHSLPHTVSLLLFFMFIGIRWLVEGATPRRAHPVRSAEKTTAASPTPPPPLILGVSSPWARSLPPTPPHLPCCFSSVPAPASSLPNRLFINIDQNILLPAETHMAVALASHTLLSTHSHALFAAVKAVLTHTFSPPPANTAVPRCL